jgi:hypothetical protein
MDTTPLMSGVPTFEERPDYTPIPESIDQKIVASVVESRNAH